MAKFDRSTTRTTHPQYEIHLPIIYILHFLYIYFIQILLFLLYTIYYIYIFFYIYRKYCLFCYFSCHGSTIRRRYENICETRAPSHVFGSG